MSVIYWDNNATTPCAPEVVEAMEPYWNVKFANASSSHFAGRAAMIAIKNAREQVAGLANCLPKEIVFTSGATESNNILFLGMLLTPNLERKQIVVSAIEHKSILEPAKLLEKHGFDIVKLPVTPNGVVDLEEAQKLITSKTLLVSVQAANNEIGTIQPIKELSSLAHDAGAYFHADAAQTLGKIPFDVDDINCDFASFSAHKMYGPKGGGALFIRGGARRWPWEKPLNGGGQEMGIRPGTSNVPAIVGFGKACEIADVELVSISSYLHSIAQKFIDELDLLCIEYFLVNKPDSSLPGVLSVGFINLQADAILANCSKFNISKDSACNSGSVGASHVLNALSLDSFCIDSVVRISFNKYSVIQDIDEFLNIINDLTKRMY